MSRPPGWLEPIVRSGEYERLARQCRTDEDLAGLLGTTKDSVAKARRRLRLTGLVVPTVQEINLGLQAGEPMLAASGHGGYPDRDDFADEERTQPGARVEVVEEKITRIEEHRLKRRVRDLESELRELTQQLSDGGEYHEVVAEVLAKQSETPPPSIEPREKTSNLREASPLVLASDWHIEEEVRPEQVAGRNRYNLEISEHRMERFFVSSRWAVDHQRDVFKVRDFICWLGGDLITNFLHDDNIETNLLHPTEAILMAQKNIIRGIDYWLLDPEIERFIFPCNDGNHGRLTEKTRAATRTQNSLEVFLYAQLAYHYRNEPRIRFILPTSAFTFLDDVYGRSIRFTHGDTFNYSGGVGGITIPLHRALARWESVKRADLTCLGHWHQRICLPNVMVNGSLIGYSAYAMSGGFAFEPPVQSMRMLDAKRWCSTDIPLWVSDRVDDSEAA